MEATIARAIQILLALGGAYLIGLWVVLIIWTYRDIEARSRSVVTQVAATMVSILFFIPGTLIYLLLRPKETLDATFQRSLEEEYLLQDIEAAAVCPSCEKPVDEEWVICAHCETRLKEACSTCGRAIDVRWSVCPYCGNDESMAAAVIRPKVTPLTRYVQPEALPEPAAVQVPAGTIREQPAVRPELPEQAPAAFIGPPAPPASVTAGPVRLFDRRRTREAMRLRELNGARDDRPVAAISSTSGHDHGAGDHENGPPSTANGRR